MTTIIKILFNKNFIKIIASFLVVVIFFAIIYYLLWYYNPDYFIVNSEFNKEPLHRLRGLVNNEIKPQKYNLHTSLFSLTDFTFLVYSYENDMACFDDSILTIESKLKESELKADSLYKIHGKVQQNNFNTYLNRMLAQDENLIDSLHKSINHLDTIKVSSSSVDNLEIQIAMLNLELSRAELNKAKRSLAIHEYYLNNFAIFQDSVLLSSYLEEYHNKELLDKSHFVYDSLKAEKKSELYKLWGYIYQYRFPSISFIDCIYFSLSISSTVSFGDIIPNSTLVRLVVIAQVLLSLFFLAIILDFFTTNYFRP